jgi:predicted negative regulator of RcsB-dependent stress response
MLDIEEQERIERIKTFLKTYRWWLSSTIFVIIFTVVGWGVWQDSKKQQAQEAAVLYDHITDAIQNAELEEAKQILIQMQNKYTDTAYTQQASLLAAKTFYEEEQPDEAQSALRWVVDSPEDYGYQPIARLRLANILIEENAYDEALVLLTTHFPGAYQVLLAMTKGDIYLGQDKLEEAKEAYIKAYKASQESQIYSRILYIKLNTLGVDPDAV